MTKEQLAALLTGREYGEEITSEEEAHAKAAGLLVLFGASDDNVDLRGAIHDQAGAYNGTTVRISRTGALLQDFDSLDKDDEGAMEAYFKGKAAGFVEIEAEWCKEENGPAWTFKTDLPHGTFLITDDDEAFCRGIVIDMADLRA